jgi:hypothetical protein
MNIIIKNNNQPLEATNLETVQLAKKITKEEMKTSYESTKKAFHFLGEYKELAANQTHLSNADVTFNPKITSLFYKTI